jgi:GNAT superfamily N-acetyltransferase
VGTDRTPAALTARARELWEFLAVDWAAARAGGEAGTAAARGTGFAPAVRVIVSPGSALCPPGWAGIVVLGDAALATAPDASTGRLVEQALGDVPAASLTDAYVLRNRLPVAEILGPSSLAYLDPAEFRPPPGTAAITALELDDRVFRQFVLAADPEEVEESGLREITTPAFAVCEHGQVVAAAGYRDWPRGTAHLSVLTAAAARGRGLGRAAASAAVARAIADDRLPQWRARPMASRRVARALGFRELGLQVSIRLAAPVALHER